MSYSPKRRVDVAIDAFFVWVALFLAYLAVGVLLTWQVVRSTPRALRLRRGDTPDI